MRMSHDRLVGGEIKNNRPKDLIIYSPTIYWRRHILTKANQPLRFEENDSKMGELFCLQLINKWNSTAPHYFIYWI